MSAVAQPTREKPLMQLCGHSIGATEKLFVIAGPCVIESEKLALETAHKLRQIRDRFNILLIYKSSFDKANRSALSSFRGPGLEAGLRILERVRQESGLPVLTDVHEDSPMDEAAAVVDVLQTPALLCRQTNFIQRVAATGLPVNLKKGQYLAPSGMALVAEKARATGNDKLLLCERGYSFGYHNLIADMRSLEILRDSGYPVVFDATHSVQLPGVGGNASGGERKFVPVLARAAVAAGIAGLFLETHPTPEQALSDGPNSWPLDRLERLLEQLLELDQVRKKQENDEPYF